MKIKVDIFFWAMIPLALAFGWIREFCLIFAAMFLHELGHIVAAAIFHRDLRGLKLLPVGIVATIEQKSGFDRSILWIYAAGPAANIAALGVSLAVYEWLGVRGYFFEFFMLSNMFTALFNMLPVIPLDGGRITVELLGRCAGYGKAIAAARRISQLFMVLFILLGALQLAGSGNNFSLLCVGIYLLMLSFSNDLEVRFMNIKSLIFRHERLKKKLIFPARYLVAFEEMPVAEALKRLDHDMFHFVTVLDAECRAIRTVSEKEILDCLLSGGGSEITFADMIKKCDNRSKGAQSR